MYKIRQQHFRSKWDSGKEKIRAKLGLRKITERIKNY